LRGTRDQSKRKEIDSPIFQKSSQNKSERDLRVWAWDWLERIHITGPHLFLTPLAQGGSGDSSGSPEGPKRGLLRIYRPLFGPSSEPNALFDMDFII
jgi:hypothetical protein